MGEAKTKISCAVSAQLICAFDFAYAKKNLFSHHTAHMILGILILILIRVFAGVSSHHKPLFIMPALHFTELLLSAIKHARS